MRVPTEWGTRAKPTKHGLTIGAINVGKYGEVPDQWTNQTEMPRGAVAIPGVEGMGYSIYEKQELWADNAADLYEEAIQRRWRPASDVPWAELKPLPDDLERAICQICTHLSEKAQLESDVLAGWEPELSYGYHEVKLYLATVIFEGARHNELFRKRALSNGGGLGLQSTGWSLRSVTDARNFTEMIAVQMVLQDSFTLVQHQYGEAYAPGPAEQMIHRMAMQDKARHIAYGIAHLKYVLLHRPERRAELERYLDKGEATATPPRARRSRSCSPAARTGSRTGSRSTTRCGAGRCGSTSTGCAGRRSSGKRSCTRPSARTRRTARPARRRNRQEVASWRTFHPPSGSKRCVSW
jgi:hypothetical protein